MFLGKRTAIYLTSPPSQNMAQSHFMLGNVHESRLMRSRCKNSWPHRHSLLVAPQAPSNKLSPSRRRRPGRDGPLRTSHSLLTQPPGTNARLSTRKHSTNCFHLLFALLIYIYIYIYIYNAQISICVIYRSMYVRGYSEQSRDDVIHSKSGSIDKNVFAYTLTHIYTFIYIYIHACTSTIGIVTFT